jgi:hypothetical protein
MRPLLERRLRVRLWLRERIGRPGRRLRIRHGIAVARHVGAVPVRRGAKREEPSGQGLLYGLRLVCAGGYSISVSSLNIGRYMAITMMPTMTPTPIIISGSMIEVSAWIAASTSSS